MLNLQQSYLGAPNTRLHHLVLPHETLLLYSTADAVVILNAATLEVRRVLAFWEAFPSLIHTPDNVSCISVDSGMKLIVASMGNRIASWSLSGVQQDTWHIHSTLVLPPNHNVTAMHNKSGLLAIATERSLSVHTLILDNDLPTWAQKWMVRLKDAPPIVRFAPSLMYIATNTKFDNSVKLYSTTSGRQTQVIPHPRPIEKVSWRHSRVSSRDDLILFTVTSDATLRIFFPVLDSPQYLQLHASLDLYSSLPFSITSAHPEIQHSSVFYLDREVIRQSSDKILTSCPSQNNVRTRRIQEIKDEGWDLFLRVLGDGSIVVTAVTNIDRRPPTLLNKFTLQQSPPSTLPSVPKYLYFLPNSTKPLDHYGLRARAHGSEVSPEEYSEIVRFVRTPEGRGVGVIRKSRGQIWTLAEGDKELIRSGSGGLGDKIVVLDKGRTFATYNTSDTTLTLHTQPPSSLTLPSINSFFTLPSKSDAESIIGITDDLSVYHIQLRTAGSTTLFLHSHGPLPLSSPPAMIVPVDPMAWGLDHPWMKHDVLLSVSDVGELGFWVPQENGPEGASAGLNGRENSTASTWVCTGKVRTGRKAIKRAKCSSAKKTALIVPCSEGEELTIWDSKESEFASGLEYRRVFSEPINDLDWTSTPDMQSILAVGFLHHVELLCQQRMTYFDEGPGWAICWKIDIQGFIPYPISDSIWLANGSFLLGAGHQMFLYGQDVSSSRGSITSTLSDESLFDYVARQNGPLEDYHPQMLLQCLLWEKVELVKDIIVNLAKDIEAGKSPRDFTTVPVERFLRPGNTLQRASHKKRYTQLFDGPDLGDDNEEKEFSRSLVMRLIESLEDRPLRHLTPNEHAHLLVLIQTTLEIDEQSRSLDANGLRYLISMRSFYILNRRASTPASPSSKGGIPRNTGRRERLRYRDMIWAFHSESHGLLLEASIAACNGKMGWSDARALGISIWTTSVETLKLQIESIARNEYMVDRDPTACSLFYFALGKVKLVHSLWRQAAWHKEQGLMLKFLSNDFSEHRWRTAALKNAYALLGKRRFEYAAAFFLLGQSLKDAVNVCIKQLGDFQTAIAIARVVEQSNEGPVFLDILRNTVLPTAFKDGNRWLASWALWLLHKRDLSVRVLVTLFSALDIQVTDIGEPHYDDPSLALLFSQLRSKTLQAAKGTSEISGSSEFNFVLQIARVFCRMGCHVLALDLVRSWVFDRPSPLLMNGDFQAESSKDGISPPSPTISRRSRFTFEPGLRRRSSIMIDMDITSLPPTRTASPERNGPKVPPVIQEEVIKDEGDFFARKAGLGDLMKSAKQDVTVPEFDMNAFF
ncbi:RAVE protein 1 C terminal-domain-containing protein [Desarmillaria tabescens]|uniref:RAVE protein 1 C terminal-domain-containing protein n=1 Tax=Armillaria tabescens TaxID=1929756 RepID=A0AA39TND8_ARMTA|nr:RAVE protein 1 C terminal-domain-containing protein [Desarmillaria tabescens]KAK0464982.1 RAVE protein 1 C terminal-domain-containing protein [Desarmillaria tabescens]